MFRMNTGNAASIQRIPDSWLLFGESLVDYRRFRWQRYSIQIDDIGIGYQNDVHSGPMTRARLILPGVGNPFAVFFDNVLRQLAG